jgi:Ca2+-binding EF-hand superfamily protein
MFPGNEAIKKHICELKKKKILVDETVRDNIARATASKQKQKGAPKSMSEFVQYSKALMELQISSLQAQLKLINALGEMPDEEKLELLFSLLDNDKDGFIDARELSDGIRKRNEGMTYAEGLDRAIKMVALFDTDGNAKLDPVEFKTLIDTMLSDMGISFHELSEYLILQILFSESGNDLIEELVGELVSKEIDQAVVEKSKFYDALADERMRALFHEFDMDGDGGVSFVEVALGLFKMTHNMEESAKVAVKLLCMLDRNDTRELNFGQFARLIMNFCAAGEFKFDDVADDLTLLICQPVVVTEAELAELIIVDAVYNMAIDMQEAAEEEEEVIDTLSYGRMHKLFDLWDENHDGFIDVRIICSRCLGSFCLASQISHSIIDFSCSQFEELLKGMRQYQTTLAIDESIQRAAQALLAFDDDGNQKLDREEFAHALTKFAKAADVDIHEFIDFLVVTSALSENDVIESAYIHAISEQATAEIKLIQNLEVEYTAIE